jgi:hypothetical protein
VVVLVRADSVDGREAAGSEDGRAWQLVLQSVRGDGGGGGGRRRQQRGLAVLGQQQAARDGRCLLATFFLDVAQLALEFL